MFVKQISVFVENRQGKLAQTIGVLKEAGIDIRALSVADTTDFGILRLIVSDPDKALSALREAGCTVSETEVLAAEVSDQPGGLASLLGLMAENSLSVEYIYAFISRIKDRAYVILKVSDPAGAYKVLTGNQVSILGENDVYGL